MPPENPAPAPSRRWTSRSVGSRLQHLWFYGLIRLGGRRAAYLFLYPVVLWYMLLRPRLRRERTWPYLSRRFPERQPPRLADSVRWTLELGRTLIDRAAVGLLGPGELDVSLEGREELLELLAGEKGLIVMTAHVGGWQASMAALSFLDRPVHLHLAREEGDVERHWHAGGGESPYRVVDPGGYLGGMLELTAALQRAEVVAVMGDRLYGAERRFVTVDFLGAPADLPVTGYKLAAATGAPIAVLLSAKTGYSSYVLRLAAVIHVPAREEGQSEDFSIPAGTFAATLEEYVRRHPFQFFNFFDLWAGPAGS